MLNFDWIVAGLLLGGPLVGHAEDRAATSTPPAAGTAAIVVESLQLDAPGIASAPLRVRVMLPPGYRNDAPVGYPVLYINDGQDLEAVDLQPMLAQLVADDAIRPLIVVAIDMPPDRMGAYGLSDRAARHGVVAQTRYGTVGATAHAYSEWLARTLVPSIDARYRTRRSTDARAVLGWSLGALNAFNLGWQYPELFGRVGAFSPSLWLSADRGDADAVQRTRLALRMVDSSGPRVGLKLFFAIGDQEETDDRDGDGVNDVLDDTRDLLDGWQQARVAFGQHRLWEGLQPRLRQASGLKPLPQKSLLPKLPVRYGAVVVKGLRQLGYTVNFDHAARATRDDVALYVLDGGQHNQASWARMLPAFLRWAYAPRAPALAATGRVDSYQDFASAHVPARNVDVWLPHGYAGHPHQRYPVLYMHDGQNLFEPGLAYAGVDWDVDGAMTRLIAEGRVREAIVVGISNTPLRLQEYMPRKPVTAASLATGVEGVAPLPRDTITSDAYLRFLVDELKPFIDATYHTRPGREDTFTMGSSMGGLISLYAMAEYPEVFGGVGAVSTHWPAGDGIVIDWLASQLPDPRTHRIYFDHGTATLDAKYAPYQQWMDGVMRAGGYVEGRNWITRRFAGAEHNESAWRARVEEPLVFLLGK